MIIVQIGTNTASWELNNQTYYDSCLQFIKHNSKDIDFVHLIEPISDCNPCIEKSYNFFNNKKIHNIAITDKDNQDELEIFTPLNNKTSGHNSSNFTHLTKHGHLEITSKKVPCYTLNTFLELNNIPKCDRLYIDTEGMDCLILLNYNYNKFKTNYIEFEIAHADGPFTQSTNADQCIARLTLDGFTISANPNEPLNLIATR